MLTLPKLTMSTPQSVPSDAPAPRQYAPPVLDELGLVTRITMGNGGSSLDGQGTMTQRGRGNDGSSDPTPGNP